MMGKATTMEGVLWATLSLTVLKTVLVANAIWGTSRSSRKGTRSFGRAGGSRLSQAPPASARSSLSGTRVVRAPSKFRSVHHGLLLMHALATLAQLAGIGQYVVPVTDSSCVVAHRVMMASLVLFDGTVVLFLLAKTHVTNVMVGSGTGPNRLERTARGFSLFWAWVCLPATAVLCAFSVPGGVSDEGAGCHGGIESFKGDHSTLVFFTAFTAGKVVLTFEFMLLLALFIKPLFARGDNGQYSIRPRHRRTVLRNIACTIGVVAAQLAETVVVYTVVYHKGNTEEVERSADTAAVVQVFLTLYFIEVTIPLGFTSFFVSARNKRRSPTSGGSAGWDQTSTFGTTRDRTARASAFNSTSAKTANSGGRTGWIVRSLSLPWHAPIHVINEERESALESSAAPV